MRVAALRVEIHLPGSQSLKQKRGTLRPLIEGLRRQGSYSVAEVGHQDDWQLATLGIAIAARDGKHLGMHISKLRNYLDSRLDIEIIDVFVTELEEPE